MEYALAQAILCSRIENLAITTADSRPLADAVVKYGDESISHNVTNLIERYSSSFNFVVTFLVELSELVETKPIRMEIAHIVCKEVVERLIEDFKFPTHLPDSEAYLYDWPRPHRYEYRNPNHGNPLPYYDSRRKYNPKSQPDDGCKCKESCIDESGDESFLESTHLSTLFELLQRFQLHEQRDRLINTIIDALPNAGLGVIEIILLPLIRDILKRLNSSENPITEYTRLSESVLSAYIDTYVAAEPPEPKDWKQDELTSCPIVDCMICQRLNIFLASPSRQEFYFSINAQGRTHIEERLEGRHCRSKLDKARTPYTLIILKIHAAWEYAHNEWRNRQGVARKAILDFGEERLNRVLGEDWEARIGLVDRIAANEESNNESKPLKEVGQGKRKRDNEDHGMQHDKQQRIVEEDESRGAVTST